MMRHVPTERAIWLSVAALLWVGGLLTQIGNLLGAYEPDDVITRHDAGFAVLVSVTVGFAAGWLFRNGGDRNG
jgi:hypothetical protein